MYYNVRHVMSYNISRKEQYIKYLFYSKLSEGLLCVIIPDICERDICEMSEGNIDKLEII